MKYDIRIPLKLHGVFLYFLTTKTSMELLERTDKIYDPTPL